MSDVPPVPPPYPKAFIFDPLALSGLYHGAQQDEDRRMKISPERMSQPFSAVSVATRRGSRRRVERLDDRGRLAGASRIRSGASDDDARLLLVEYKYLDLAEQERATQAISREAAQLRMEEYLRGDGSGLRLPPRVVPGAAKPEVHVEAEPGSKTSPAAQATEVALRRVDEDGHPKAIERDEVWVITTSPLRAEAARKEGMTVWFVGERREYLMDTWKGIEAVVGVPTPEQTRLRGFSLPGSPPLSATEVDPNFVDTSVEVPDRVLSL